MKNTQAMKFMSTITMRDGSRFEIEERMTVATIECEAIKVGAVKIQLENGTEIFLK